MVLVLVTHPSRLWRCSVATMVVLVQTRVLELVLVLVFLFLIVMCGFLLQRLTAAGPTGSSPAEQVEKRLRETLVLNTLVF